MSESSLDHEYYWESHFYCSLELHDHPFTLCLWLDVGEHRVRSSHGFEAISIIIICGHMVLFKVGDEPEWAKYGMSEWLECISDGTKCDRDRGDVFAGVAVGDEDFGHKEEWGKRWEHRRDQRRSVKWRSIIESWFYDIQSSWNIKKSSRFGWTGESLETVSYYTVSTCPMDSLLQDRTLEARLRPLRSVWCELAFCPDLLQPWQPHRSSRPG